MEELFHLAAGLYIAYRFYFFLKSRMVTIFKLITNFFASYFLYVRDSIQAYPSWSFWTYS